MDAENILEVDSLLKRVASISNIGYWLEKNPFEYVRGKVTQVSKPSYGRVYVTLSGDEGQLKLVCNENQTPALGQYIICKGEIEQTFNKYINGIEVQIKGSPVGEWEPKVENFKADTQLRKSSHKPLALFLNEHGFENLLFLGSDTGIRDAISQANKQVKGFLSHQINVSDATKIIAGLKEAMSTEVNAQAVAIVRGGDDDSIDQWDEPNVVQAFIELNIPFYVAIGHSHRNTLLDKYADQAFSTPSALGSAMAHAVQQQSQVIELRQDAMHIQSRLDQANIDKNSAQKNYTTLRNKWHAQKSNNNSNLKNVDPKEKVLLAIKAFVVGLIVSAAFFFLR